VVKPYLLPLFMMLFFLGCNSQYADLNPMTNRAPFMVQLGTTTKLSGFNNSLTDYCSDIAVDRLENTICAGTTTGSMGTLSDGTGDGFVAKLDRHGKLLWITQLQSPDLGSEGCQTVAVDAAGNTYCGGTTNKRLGTGEILNKNAAFVVQERTVAAADNDAFVAKINPSGKIVWIKQFGSYGNEGCNNIDVSPSGNSYCGARTDGEIGVDAATNTYEYLGATSMNPMVAKIDTNGNVIWIRQFGVLSVGAEYLAEDYCSGVAIDEDENVYCGGATRGNIVTQMEALADLIRWCGFLIKMESQKISFRSE
jgi:outer membrane protein assembly factor BamB